MAAVDEKEEGDVTCPTCGNARDVEAEVGSASGRRHFRCGRCGAQWREKNAAAVALGALGGRAAADNMTPEQRSARAREAAEERWRREKTRDNAVPPEFAGVKR